MTDVDDRSLSLEHLQVLLHVLYEHVSIQLALGCDGTVFRELREGPDDRLKSFSRCFRSTGSDDVGDDGDSCEGRGRVQPGAASARARSVSVTPWYLGELVLDTHT